MMAEPAIPIEALRAGDPQVFEVVVNRYGDALARYLARLVGDRALAEELAQETLLQAYRALPRMTGALALRPWLYKIATNNAYKLLRRRRLIQFLPLLEHFGGGPSLEGRMAERDEVGRALAALDEESRTLLVLTAVEGFSYQEAGAIVGLKPEAARKRIYRAKQKFREAYEGAD
jgi:RNA polymerase sigma-70 factor (ECF subfamily)